MIIVNLDKYSADGFKQSANSLVATSPDNITHARLYYDSFAGTDFIQGAFVVGKNSTLEFDNSGVSFTKYKLFESTDGVTYTENKTYGGTEGRDEFNSSLALDPADYEDDEIIVKDTVNGVESFIPINPVTLLTNLNFVSTVNYILRGRLGQANAVQSGKACFGTYFIDESTGLTTATTSATLTGSASITIADRILRSSSAKISTGIYSLQCQVSDGAGGFTNGFRNGIDGTQYAQYFVPYVQPVFGNYSETVDGVTPQPISAIQRYSATRIRIKLSGQSQHYTATNSIDELCAISDLVCDLLPLPFGMYTITDIVNDGTIGDQTGYIEIGCNTTSGTGTFVDISSSESVFFPSSSYFVYADAYIPELKGWLVLDTQHELLTYYGTGKLIFKTYNTSWVLTDDIIDRALFIDIKFPIGLI
jgi:hypothetical protein